MVNDGGTGKYGSSAMLNGKTNNSRNIYWFARQNNIKKSEQLTRKELEDGL